MNKWRGNPWAILAVLSLGFFMTLLDLTIVNIAIPDMVGRLDASLDQILWVVNAYALALAVLLITAGRLGDLRGKKTLYLSGVGLFTLASLACGLAQGPGQLIAFRAIQGIGAAMLIPQTLSMIIEVFPAEKRGAALGVWGATAGLSGAVGPSFGGLLVSRLDWRWIFFVNVPIGVLVIAAGLVVMPAAKRTVRHRFDVPGVVLASISLFCLAFGLIEGEKYDWNGLIQAMIAVAVVTMAIFLVYQRGQQDNEPLVPFELFRERGFTLINFVGVAVSFGIVGLSLPLTIYLQSVLGFSAVKAGLLMLPLAAGAVISAGPAGVLSQRLGGKYILMAGLTAFGGGMVWVAAAAGAGSGGGVVIAPLFVTGLGAGCTFTPMASEVMRNVPARLSGAASGVNNALRQVGSVLAAAVVGAVLQARLASSLREQAQQRAGEIPAAYRDRFVQGFDQTGGHLEIGGGSRPANLPADVAHRVEVVAAQVFGHGFVDAMRPTIFVSAGVLLAGLIACLFVRSVRGPSANPHGLPVSDEELAAQRG
ncbi:DHA2 family efflux MFS transporter permease subunit [Actinoallomurus bryophytorum]|uniref:EmrB/QacA subfamily drug resistance transporter n=1 Tax=Actinoallomurus bryophytorum TaxID=1490222 RepID=A0A543CI75_9ACTN|nr:DHA2 family efflux MFS transporter permease subunit [Actinoallomurus bryophytorum]TQL96788.1 EmrB/QacA subfamily drug resistance transporter [Actinoallomurus bryophytorum]